MAKIHLRLTHGASYTGKIKATRKNPDVIVEDKAIADEAVATGYFEVVSDEANSKADPEPVADAADTEAEVEAEVEIDIEPEKKPGKASAENATKAAADSKK